MGDQLYTLNGKITLPVEPVGLLASEGWMPGTWAKYSATPVSFSGAIATVDRSDGMGVLAGFLVTGPQHKQPVELMSDMWTTDKRQRPGGDTKEDWGAFDAGAAFELDNNLQLQRMGSRIVSMQLPNEGIHKVYVFEADTPGGVPLVYQPGDKLYVSYRGRFTKFQEMGHVWCGYVVAQCGSDMEGNYIIAAEAYA